MMTRALCSRSSKRKPAKSSQDVVPDDCKENSPSILSQGSNKKLVANKKCPVDMKENVSPRRMSTRFPKSVTVDTADENCSPIRKSCRHPKKVLANKNKCTKIDNERSVLCDKTNSPWDHKKKSNEQSFDILKTIGIKNNKLHKIVTVPQPKLGLRENICSNRSNNVSHVPIYKSVLCSLEETSENKGPSLEKNEAVYEFEVDENEEPVQTKKRKKRAYTRKPKTGPKALTINNIKYSSSESLVSLPEKPVAQKRKNKCIKSNLKPYSSVNNLNDSEDTCYSVKSFMSHPPSLLLCGNKKITSKPKLSILQESQSEQCQSPAHNSVVNLPLDLYPDVHSNHFSSPFHSVNTSVTSKVDNPSSSHDLHFSPNPRCYVSKTGHNTSNLHPSSYHNTANETPPHQATFTNVSTVSSHDFLSSTPFKRASLVVCNNSVFDETYNDLPQGMRPSTGFVKSASATPNPTDDNFFGFDEPEELEEPLVSPIKNNFNTETRKAVKLLPKQLVSSDTNQPKPSVQEVIEMLKATLTKSKAVTKEVTEVYNDSPGCSREPSPKPEDEETIVNFKKPPRRSYERQRRVHYQSEHEDEKSSEEEEIHKAEKKQAPKASKKYCKKANKTKTEKPARMTKGKQRAAKEEEAMEKLVAQMNAQFQEIEKINLVVE